MSCRIITARATIFQRKQFPRLFFQERSEIRKGKFLQLLGAQKSSAMFYATPI